jgi:hypothetical protein
MSPRNKSKCTGKPKQISNIEAVWTCSKKKWIKVTNVHSAKVKVPNYPSAPASSNVNAVRPIQSAGISNIQECKIRDARIVKTQPGNVGFPLTPDIIPVSGTVRLIGAPIDFPDASGSKEFLVEMKRQQLLLANWFRYFSEGRLNVEWITTDEWIRAPRPAGAYQTSTPGPNTYASSITDQWNAYAQEFVNSTGSAFNWDGIHGVFFHFPDNSQTGIPFQLLGRGTPLMTPQGSKNLFYWADGNYQFRMARSNPHYFAALWVHEILHSMGAALHAPGNGFQTGVGQNQGGKSWSFNAWEMFKSGWLSDDQVYCASPGELTSSVINLKPLEVPGPGLRAAIVPLNTTQALIVESRRPFGYSDDFDSRATGILVYLLDTRSDNDRSNEGSGADCGNNPNFPKWSYYVAPDQRPINSGPPCQPRYIEYFLQPGETITRDGVVISYDLAGSLDTVTIRKA